MKKARAFWERALEPAPATTAPNLVLAADFFDDDGDRARAATLARRYLRGADERAGAPRGGRTGGRSPRRIAGRGPDDEPATRSTRSTSSSSGAGWRAGCARWPCAAAARACGSPWSRRAPSLGGNHTWSFHASDVDDEGAALLEPLVVRRWPQVEVAFPDHQRRLPMGYATLTSASLARAVSSAFAERRGAGELLLGAQGAGS